MICFHSCVTEWPHYILEVESILGRNGIRQGLSEAAGFTQSPSGTVPAATEQGLNLKLLAALFNPNPRMRGNPAMPAPALRRASCIPAVWKEK